MKKKIVRWILPVCMMLLLAGCGKSSNTVVTGTYYNPSKDAENTAQTVGTEADANDVLDAMEQGTEQELSLIHISKESTDEWEKNCNHIQKSDREYQAGGRSNTGCAWR